MTLASIYVLFLDDRNGSPIKEMRCDPAEPRNDFKMKRRAEAVLGVSLDSEDCCERGPKKLQMQENPNHGDVIMQYRNIMQADLPHFTVETVYSLLLTCMDLMHVAESGSLALKSLRMAERQAIQ